MQALVVDVASRGGVEVKEFSKVISGLAKDDAAPGLLAHGVGKLVRYIYGVGLVRAMFGGSIRAAPPVSFSIGPGSACGVVDLPSSAARRAS